MELTGKCTVCLKIKTIVPGTKEPICCDCYVEISNKMYFAYKRGLARDKFFIEKRKEARNE